MKKLTTIFIAALIASLVGCVIWVTLSPDFVEPKKLPAQEISADNPIWDKSIDDLAEYLVEQGIIPSTEYTEFSDGIATIARMYSGVELYWWDVENLEEGSAEYKSYESAVTDGTIDLWGSGNIMTVTVRGPFAYDAGYYGVEFSSTPEEMERAFLDFCKEE